MNRERFFKNDKEKEQFLDWLVALRESALPQGSGYLESEQGFCCLGVGVSLFCENPDLYEHDEGTILLVGNFPEKDSPKWLYEINKDFGTKYGMRLSVLNDGDWKDGKMISRKHTFPEIADKLWEVYGWEF